MRTGTQGTVAMVPREEAIRAWHGAHDSGRLTRHGAAGEKHFDGPAVAVGLICHEPGAPIPCQRGLHGSVRAVDMLRYTAGGIICRTAHWGRVAASPSGDKLASEYREVLAVLQPEAALRCIVGWAAGCVQEMWSVLRTRGVAPDPRGVAVIDVVLRWCRGEATPEGLRTAYATYAAAASGAYAATYAAAYAAAAATDAAAAASAAASAAAATDAAAYAAYAAADAAASAAAAADAAARVAAVAVRARYADELECRLLALIGEEASAS